MDVSVEIRVGERRQSHKLILLFIAFVFAFTLRLLENKCGVVLLALLWVNIGMHGKRVNKNVRLLKTDFYWLLLLGGGKVMQRKRLIA